MREITTAELKQLQGEGKKVLVDFYAVWCMPCKQLIPKLEKMSTEYDDITFVKVDVDQNQDFAVELGIRGVPTVMIFNGEELIYRSSGLQPDSVYKEVLDKL